MLVLIPSAVAVDLVDEERSYGFVLLFDIHCQDFLIDLGYVVSFHRIFVHGGLRNTKAER